MKRIASLAASVLILVGCSAPEPQPIDYGNTQCTACKMMVADPRFGAEAVTTTGKVFVFDALECMMGWYLSEAAVPTADVHSLWVSDHANPGTLVNTTSAWFVESPNLHSPMSMDVAAFSSQSDQHAAISRYGGRAISYEVLLELAEDYR